MSKEYMIPVFVPYSKEQKKYIFNDTKSKDKKEGNKIDIKTIEKQIEKNLKNINDNDGQKEIIFYGGNFTSLNVEIQEEILKSMLKYIEEKEINSVTISANPTEIDKETIKRLKKYKVKSIDLEALSTNDYILKRARVNYKFKDIKSASKLIRWNRFNLNYKVIVGLPESTRIDEINTAKTLIKLKPKSVKVYPMLVTKGTRLEDYYNKQRYEPLTRIQAIERCKTIVRMFADKKIEISAIGIKNIEDIFNKENGEDDIVAGPFHQNFRKLVETEMWYDAILEKIKKLNMKVKEVTVSVNPIDKENVIGQDKSNIKKLKELYEVNLKIKPDENIAQGKLKIEDVKEYNDFLE